MSELSPTIPTGVARRPRVHRTQENYEFARQMEAMLSSATSYRGTGPVRRKPTNSVEDGTAVTSTGDVEVGGVHVGMDGVESVELVTPQRPRHEINDHHPHHHQQQHQQQRPTTNDDGRDMPTREETRREGREQYTATGDGDGGGDGGGGVVGRERGGGGGAGGGLSLIHI